MYKKEADCAKDQQCSWVGADNNNISTALGKILSERNMLLNQWTNLVIEHDKKRPRTRLREKISNLNDELIFINSLVYVEDN